MGTGVLANAAWAKRGANVNASLFPRSPYGGMGRRGGKSEFAREERGAMSTETVMLVGRYLLHLIDCGLHGGAAQRLPAGVSWQQVHALAASQSVEGVSWFGARTCSDVPSELRKQWESEAQATLFRRVRFDVEREQVFAALNTVGLAVLPMKGSVIADYYPSPEMRSMADNDFLYGFVGENPEGAGFRICGETPAARKATTERGVRAIVDVMRRRGYSVASQRVGNHESFHKPPIFNFEPHRRLAAPDSSLAGYYENPWQRALQDATNPLLFGFNDEDEYLFVIAHAYKHFSNAGCGFRFVVDVRAFLDARGMQMNWDYVFDELQKMGLFDFEARVRGLADAAFGGTCTLDAPLSGGQLEMLRFMLGSGTYGTIERVVRKRLEKQKGTHKGNLAAAKCGYLLQRLTDPVAVEAHFPRASKIAPLRPVLQLARYARGIVRNPKKLTNEVKLLMKEE